MKDIVFGLLPRTSLFLNSSPTTIKNVCTNPRTIAYRSRGCISRSSVLMM